MYTFILSPIIIIIMSCRPALVSLDLSYNFLSDIEAAVRLLAEVSSLRNLLLMGNPLSVSKHILLAKMNIASQSLILYNIIIIAAHY